MVNLEGTLIGSQGARSKMFCKRQVDCSFWYAFCLELWYNIEMRNGAISKLHYTSVSACSGFLLCFPTFYPCTTPSPCNTLYCVARFEATLQELFPPAIARTVLYISSRNVDFRLMQNRLPLHMCVLDSCVWQVVVPFVSPVWL